MFHPGAAPPELYPDSIEMGGQKLSLSYCFSPGDAADGVTISLPLERLNTLQAGQLQWLVPGLLREKVIALLKNLPKVQRRSFTPVPQFADAALARLHEKYPTPLLPALADSLQAMTGAELNAQALDETRLPDYLRFRVELVDDKGRPLASSRDLLQLQQQFGGRARRQFMAGLGQDLQRDGEHDWVFGDLPDSIFTEDSGGQRIPAWPAVVDQHDAVGLGFFATAQEAALEHQDGVLRLLDLQLKGKLRDLSKHHGLSTAGLLAWCATASTETLIADLANSSLKMCVGNRATDIRTRVAFADLLGLVRAELGLLFRRQSAFLDATLRFWARLDGLLNDDFYRLRPEVFNDMRSQLDDLVADGFLQDLSPPRLEHYPRYLEAMPVLLPCDNCEFSELGSG